MLQCYVNTISTTFSISCCCTHTDVLITTILRSCVRVLQPTNSSSQPAFYRASINPPYLPYIGDLLAQLFGCIPEISNTLIEPALENAVAGAL